MAVMIPGINPDGTFESPAVKAGISQKVADDINVEGTPVRAALTAAYVDRGGLHIDPSAPQYGGTPLPDSSGAGADSTNAIMAAIDHAKSMASFVNKDVARRVHLNGWYKFNQDLYLDASGIEITGEGGNSGLLGINAGVILGGTTSLTMRHGLRNMRVRRVTTAGNEHGTALLIEGGGMNTNKYPCRWFLDHVEAESPVHPSGLNPQNSVAVKMRGTFLATVTALYARNAHAGLVIENDAVNNNLAANAITFIGGEIQGVNRIGSITGAIGIAFYGMAWEGASEAGMDCNGVNGLTVDGGYFEKNAGYDLRIGEVSNCLGVKITGGVSSVGALAGTPEGATKRSIILRRSYGTDISGMYFLTYDVPPVHVNEVSNGVVTGDLQNCHHSRGAIPVVQVTAGRDWSMPTYQRMVVDNSAMVQDTSITLRGRSGQRRALRFETGASARWWLGADPTSESGTAVGSNFSLRSYNNSGTLIGDIWTVSRETGQTRFHAGHRVDGELDHRGTLAGFYGKAPVSRPALTYSKAGETPAEAQLRAALVALGLVTDSTTA